MSFSTTPDTTGAPGCDQKPKSRIRGHFRPFPPGSMPASAPRRYPPAVLASSRKLGGSARNPRWGIGQALRATPVHELPNGSDSLARIWSGQKLENSNFEWAWKRGGGQSQSLLEAMKGPGRPAHLARSSCFGRTAYSNLNRLWLDTPWSVTSCGLADLRVASGHGLCTQDLI